MLEFGLNFVFIEFLITFSLQRVSPFISLECVSLSLQLLKSQEAEGLEQKGNIDGGLASQEEQI